MDKFWQLKVASYLKIIRGMAVGPVVAPWVTGPTVPVRIFFITVVPVQNGLGLKITKYRFFDRGSGLLTGVRTMGSNCLESTHFFGSAMAWPRQSKHFAERFKCGRIEGGDVYLLTASARHKDISEADFQRGFEIGMRLNVNGGKNSGDLPSQLPNDWNVAPSRQYVQVTEIPRVRDHYLRIYEKANGRD